MRITIISLTTRTEQTAAVNYEGEVLSTTTTS